MVGDIDFIVSKNDYLSTINILLKFRYTRVNIGTRYDFPQFKHYHRLKKDKNIAAIEIHKEFLREEHANEFNFNFIKNDVQNLNGYHVLSYNHQFALSIIAKQINDQGFYYNTIALRNAYDIFLLSKKTNSKTAFNNLNKLTHPLNCFVAICHNTFNEPESLEYIATTETNLYLNKFKKELEDDLLREKNFKKTERKLFIKQRLTVIKKSFYNKNFRKWLIKRLSEKSWYKEKFRQLRAKNSS